MNAVTRAALAAFPDQLEAHFAAFPPGFMRWVPASWDGVPSEPLTALEQLCHVRDIEIDGYQLRIRRTLADEPAARVHRHRRARARTGLRE